MGLEAATYVSDLTATNPLSTDKRKQGDDHLRLLKSVLKSTFPNADKPFYFRDYEAITTNETVAEADMNKVYGASSTGGAFTVTLPTTLGTSLDGFMVSVVKLETNANRVTVAPSSGNINGVASLSITNLGDRIDCYWTGTAWYGVVTLAGVDRCTLTASATIDATHFDKLIDITPASANATLTLPASATYAGRVLMVKLNSASYTCTLTPNGAETIDGASSWVLRERYDYVALLALSGGWFVLDAIGGSVWATAAEFISNTSRKILTASKVWDAAVAGAGTWNASSTTTLDLSTYLNWTLTTATGNSTLDASNLKEGQTGVIAITQGATPRTLAYASKWVFAGSTDPSLTAIGAAKDLLFYQVLPGATQIFGNLVKNVG